MSLLSYLARLRKLPVKERRETAVTWTVLIVVLVGLIWLVALVSGFGSLFEAPSRPDTPLPGSAEQGGITPPY